MRYPIPADWDGESFCHYSVCWPDSPLFRIILRGLLTEPTRGYFWDERTGSVIDVLSQIRQTLDYNLELREVIMACGDNGLNEALLAIAAALGGGGAGGAGGGGCGGGCLGENVQVQQWIEIAPGAFAPHYGTEPDIQLGEGEVPEGYADLAEYDADKCQVAAQMANDFINSLRNMGNVNWAVGVIGAAAVVACLVGLIVVPAAAIPVLLFALLGNVGITAALIQLADYLEDNKQELICGLYTGDNAEGVIGFVADMLDVAIGFLAFSGPVGAAVKAISLVLLSSDTLNYLFSRRAHQIYSDADCMSCVCPEFVLGGASGPFAGTELIEQGENYWILGAGDYSDRDRFDVAIYFNATAPCAHCGPPMQISVELLSGSITEDTEGTWGYRVYNADCDHTYHSVSVPPVGECGFSVGVVSATDFTVRVEVAPCDV